MKILGIMGSPRSKGNTNILLDEVFKGAQGEGIELEKVEVNNLKIKPCQENYGCLKDGNCVIRDDMTDIYIKLMNADVVVLASPIFFYSLSAQVKALIDRCQALWVRKYVLKQSSTNNMRKGAFICVGATKGKLLFDGSILTVKYFFEAIGVNYAEELLVRGVDKEGEINDHPDILKSAFEMGQRLKAQY